MKRKLIIIGGGLAGLSAGCYARGNGLDVTLVEHNSALGGVCTAWTRGPYTIDGCIHWLTGGPFQLLYDELGISAAVELKALQQFTTYRDVKSGVDVAITANLDKLLRALTAIAPEDREELGRLIEGAMQLSEMRFPMDRPAELMTLRDTLSGLWEMRHDLGVLVHFRKSLGSYTHDHLHNPLIKRMLTRLAPPEAPALFLLMILGYLARGWLSRPVGGTAAFRDALIATYQSLGGETRPNTTVDEVLIRDHRAVGVRLQDGTLLEADAVISTSSAPETVLRLLGGRYDADRTHHRLEHWKLFTPIVLASFGVETPLAGVPPMLLIDGIEPFEVGGHSNDYLYLRVCNDDALLAPEGHAVVQTMLATGYDWWATRGAGYQAAKDAVGRLALAQIERHLPGCAQALRMTDVATPLTYWTMARSWRGAFEGWMPNTQSFFGHVDKRLKGLQGFYMAGQWVEPGGGVPTALSSGRQVIQLLCADLEHPFAPLRAGQAGAVTRH